MEREFQRCFTLEELPGIVSALRAWAPGVSRWLLYGPMGAGKTTLVRAWLGEVVSSPTFTYINPYPSGIHIDLYRFPLNVPSRVEELYTWLEEAPLIFIEWAEKLPSPPPSPWVDLHLTIQDEYTRCLRALLRERKR